MRQALAAVVFCISATFGLPAAVAAAEPACAAPVQRDDGWRVQPDPAAAGFAPQALCDAMKAFNESPRNLHALLVERHGQLVAESYREGPDRSTGSLWATRTRFDATTLHDVRSVTKSVVGLLWGIAEAEGKLPPITTPVLDLLPALADLRTGGRERITVRDALCMRSGLAWDESGGYRRWGNDEFGLFWRSDRARFVFDRPMAAMPGQRFNYNGGLTAVLALLLEERTGMDLKAYAAQKLFAPLGIQHWEWGGDLRGRTRGYAGLRLLPRDLARIGRLVLDGGRWQGQQVVPQAWVQAATAPCVSGGDYGYQWWSGSVWASGKPFAWQGANGNGGQRLFVVPALDMVVVAMAGEYDDGTVGRVQRYWLEQVVGAAREPGGRDGAVPVAAAPAPAAAEAAPGVETRATLVSIHEESGGQSFVYLKLFPGAKMPFSTQRFRVRDRGLLTGLKAGESVKFRAGHVDGENTLLAIRVVPACVRFQPCE